MLCSHPQKNRHSSTDSAGFVLLWLCSESEHHQDFREREGSGSICCTQRGELWSLKGCACVPSLPGGCVGALPAASVNQGDPRPCKSRVTPQVSVSHGLAGLAPPCVHPEDKAEINIVSTVTFCSLLNMHCIGFNGISLCYTPASFSVPIIISFVFSICLI